MRGFAGIDLSVAAVPDATTVLNFRHWLEEHDLTRTLFDEVGAMLEERGLLMRQGTIVDATIIAAPPSTKNKSKARDPKMHQTKKGNLGLTRIGGHPEAFARGATDAQNTPTVFARVSPPDGGSRSCRT